jgi:ubiquinone/menaquinone biosynthesis C-methylase UbiE
MNLLHHWLCRSNYWRKTIEHRIPWVLAGTDLGHNVLELGPGPGLTTDLLRHLVRHLTALEIDQSAAASLSSRLHGTSVEVLIGDATAMPFADRRFSAAVCFTMLHHVPSPQLQDRLLREVWRVLQPGGVFMGSDTLQSWFMRVIHVGDTLVPINPHTFAVRLQSAGFEAAKVETNSHAFRFSARKPNS